LVLGAVAAGAEGLLLLTVASFLLLLPVEMENLPLLVLEDLLVVVAEIHLSLLLLIIVVLFVLLWVEEEDLVVAVEDLSLLLIPVDFLLAVAVAVDLPLLVLEVLLPSYQFHDSVQHWYFLIQNQLDQMVIYDCQSQ
jgi:hypothetical protein